MVYTMYYECCVILHYTKVDYTIPVVHHVIHVKRYYHHQVYLTNVYRMLVCLFCDNVYIV
jgi:hypothetical protein